MPKIVIQELDYTSAGTGASIDSNVLIPGTSTMSNHYFKINADGKSVTDVTPQEGGEAPTDYDYYTGGGNTYEFTSATASLLDGIVGTTSTPLCHKIAKKLLDLGMTVLYAFHDEESGSTSSIESYDNFWKKFADKGVYDIRFIISGGTDEATVAKNMIKCAASRGDAVALVDVPESYTYTPVGGTAKSYDSWSQESCNKYINEAIGGISSEEAKYGAGFGPGVIVDAITYPGSFAYLACYATYSKLYENWFAYAGPVRGAIPYTVKLPVLFGDADIDVLQSRTVAGHRACNAICPIRPYGNLVWGNRTMYPNTATPGATEPDLIASSFLNIRMLCCDIKKTLYKASRSLTFEPNSDLLWVKFTSAITPLLEKMKAGQGIRGYQIIKKAGRGHEKYESKKGTLCATIRIIPIEAVEDFYLTVSLEDSIEVVEG